MLDDPISRGPMQNASGRKRRRPPQIETLEERILRSVTWVDADGITHTDSTDGNDTGTGDGADDSLSGHGGDDHLVGGDGSDTLHGDAGNDTLLGQGGNDILSGGPDDDTLDGGDGNDTVDYSDAPGGVTVDLSTGTATGDGHDAISHVENVTGSAHDDTLTGDDGANILSGGAGNDVLHGGDGNDALLGGDGNDTLHGGAGDDNLQGGAGTDTADYHDASSGVTVDLAHGTTTGGAGNDTLSGVENATGSTHDDVLIGDSGNNTLDGGDGNDVLQGGLGNDTLIGGAGSDTAHYGDATSGVTVDLSHGTATGGAGNDTLSGIEHVTGSNYNDTLIGDSGNNTLDGGAGNDTLDGGLGNDTLIGGAGTDTVTYASASGSVNVDLAHGTSTGAHGNDTLSGIENITGSSYDDLLQGDSGANVISGGAGDDHIEGGAGNDTLDGGAGSDTVHYDHASSGVTVDLAHGTANGGDGTDTLSNFEHVVGSVYNDTLIGNSGANTLSGGAGDDHIEGGAGNDTLDGGAGSDTVHYDHATSGVTVDLAHGTATGGDGTDSLSNFENATGSNYGDTLIGDSGNNALDGGAGNDTLDGGLGNDTLIGGAGIDTATYASATGAVNVNLASGTATGAAGSDTLSGIENVTGGAYNDTLTGDSSANVLGGGAGDDTLVGGGGDDTLIGGAGVDTADYSSSGSGVTVNLAAGTATGGAGNDTLSGIENVTGSSSNDTLIGDAGANVLLGGAGNDTLFGGGGNDTIDGGSGTDTLDASSATSGQNITLSAGGITNVENLTGSAYNDTLTGDAGANVIDGGAGNDTLDGGLGDDTLIGGAGTDTATYAAATGGVTVDLAHGTASGALGNDTLSGIESVTGSNYDDTLIGDSGANVISAGAGDDSVEGGAGNDTLDGGSGTDTVHYDHATSGVTVNLSTGTATGGDGTDTLSNFENVVGSDYNDTLTGNSGANVLTGGAGDDRIDGGSGDDVIHGGLGNDTLIGGRGVDTVDYGDASSGVIVDLARGTASGAAGNDRLSGFENVVGTTYNDTITGSSGRNFIDAGGGDDTISAGRGNDYIIAGAGNDRIDGGAGQDTLSFEHANSSITADLNTGRATGEGSDTLSSIENLTGGSGNDTLVGNASANTLIGGAGNDTISGGNGNDIIDGGAGDDQMDGGIGSDTVSFGTAQHGITVDLVSGVADGDGHDTLRGFENVTGSSYADVIRGDAGANSLKGGAGDDVLCGEGGNDTIDGGSGIDTVSYARTAGGVTIDLADGSGRGAASSVDGNDRLTNIENVIGSAYDDVIHGNSSNNVLEGGAGNDVLDGEGGTDTASYAFASGPVRVDLGSGSASGSEGEDTLISIENVIGSHADDIIIGTSASNMLAGGAGNDLIEGGGGNDTLLGEAGNDRIEVNHQAGGSIVTVDGGADDDTLDLGAYHSSQARLENGRVTIALEDGQEFSVIHQRIEHIQFSDQKIDLGAGDTAALADAGSDQAVAAGATVELSAGEIQPGASYEWVQVSGPAVTLSDSNVAAPAFEAPSGVTNVNITFELRVSDGTNTSVDTVTVLVNPNDEAPTADAGPDAIAGPGETIQLAGDGTDPSGEGLTYEWVQTSGPAVSLSDSTAPNPTFTAPEGVANTDVAFELRVSDGSSTSVDTVTIHVNPVNEAPSVDAGVDQSVAERDVVRLQGSATDREHETLAFEWVQTSGPAVALSDVHAANPTFTAPEGVSNTDVTFELRVSDGTNTSVDTVTVHVNADDDAPAADAGLDQTVDEHALVQLSGGGSDAEDQSLSFEWVQTAGPAVALSDPHALNPTFTAPEGVANADLTFELRVSDGTNVSVDTVTIHVNADDDAPSADAGADQFVEETAPVQLHGAGTDPEGQTLSYEWVQTSGPAVTLSDAHSASPTFTAPQGLSNSELTFELRVSDGTNTSVDTVAIHVNAQNDEPAANAGVDQTVDESTLVQLQGVGTDPEGQGLTYEWVQTAGPAVSLSDAHSPNPTFVAPEGVVNTDLRFELRVSDGDHTSVDSVTIHVNADDDAPTVDAGADQHVSELDSVSLHATAHDPEGQTLTYEWVQTAGPAVALSDPHASNPTFTAPQSDSDCTVQFEVRVSDGTHVTVDSLTVHVAAGNDAPVVEVGDSITVDESQIVQLSAHASDVDSTGLTFEWVQTSGPTVALSDAHSAQPTFRAPEGVANTDLTFELRVSDGTNATVAPLTVHVNADDDAPNAQAGPDQNVDEGTLVHLLGAGQDREGQALTYEWVQTAGPAVQLSDAHDTTPSFVAPQEVSNVDLTFELRVSDGTNTSVDTVTIHVNADDDAPSANAGADQSVDETDHVQLSGAASDPEGQGLTYEWVQTSGPAVTLSDVHSQHPTFAAPEGVANTDLTFELHVSDGTNTSIDTVTIHVNADDDAPSADAGADQTVDENAVVQLSGAGNDSEGQSLSYEWVQTSGPAVTLSDAHAANPTFTALEGVSNTDLTFELRVSDGTNTSVDTVTIHVNADDDAPSADAGADQTVDENAAVQLIGAGSDVEGQTLTYEWVQTSGPAVTLSDAHVANPTFTAPEAVANTDVTFELHVSDGTNTSVDTITIHVNADNDAPSADAGADQTVDENAVVQLSGSGTDIESQALTYEWVQTGGPAVTLSDAHAANPTFTAPEAVANTDVTFELHVSDGTNTSIDTVTIHVNADDDAPTADAGIDQAVSAGAVVQLQAAGTDPEGETLTYEWVQTAGPTVTLSDPHSAAPTFAAPNDASASDIVFELHVSDGANTSVDTTAVHVDAAAVLPPTAPVEPPPPPPVDTTPTPPSDVTPPPVEPPAEPPVAVEPPHAPIPEPVPSVPVNVVPVIPPATPAAPAPTMDHNEGPSPAPQPTENAPSGFITEPPPLPLPPPGHRPSLWSGDETLRVLDAGVSPAVEYDESHLAALADQAALHDASHLAAPQSRFEPTGDIWSRPPAPRDLDEALTFDGSLERVFEDVTVLSLQRADLDSHAQPEANADESGFLASDVTKETGVHRNYESYEHGGRDEHAVPDLAKAVATGSPDGFLGLLWGLVRGRAGAAPRTDIATDTAAESRGRKRK